MGFRPGHSRAAKAAGFLGVASLMVGSMATPAIAKGNANTAGPPTTRGVQPTYSGGNITTCPRGTTTFINTSDSNPGDKSASYSKAGTTFQTTVDSTGMYLSFMTNSPSFTVYVKGGPAFDTYDYSGKTGHPAYPSDSNLHSPINNGGNIATISHYLVCGQRASTKASPAMSTTPSAGGTVGSVVLNDSATLSGGSSPTGSLTFNLYDPSQSTCTGTPVDTETVTVTGDGTYSTSNTTAANKAGTWRWTVAYSGDAKNNSAVSTCGAETVSVSKASPSVSTSPSAGGPQDSVVLNDTATLSSGFHPTGSLVFKLFDPSHTDCSSTPAYSETVTVSGNGSYSTHNKTPANKAGKWSWTVDYTGDSNNNMTSSGCGRETVTVTPAVAQGSCEGSSSLSTLVSGSNVVSYTPKGNWESSATGIDVVNVEGSSVTNTLVPTGSDVINSCASNSVTGQTVCTSNGTHVYVLKGNGLDPSVSPNPLTDGGVGQISFSGGSATTSGVAMDAADNKALLALSVPDPSTGGTTAGFQFLDLATNTFEAPFKTMDPAGEISENPLIDPLRHLILSAAEDNNYELINVATSTAPKYYEHPVSGFSSGNIMDSSSEDCSTGIILGPAEFSNPSEVEIADINNPGAAPRAVFTDGSPGSWSAPEQVQTLTGSVLSAGASGSAVAQGTHTGVLSGEFGGDALTAITLPTTSGAGAVPAISNWVTCHVGADSAGTTFAMGFDPHTLAAYQSPNGGHAFALLVNEDASEMARVDLTAMLNPSTVPATGNVCDSGTLPSGTVSFISLP